MNDIDSLKKRVAELEKANIELEDVFNAMGDPTFVINNDSVITRVNDACASFLKTDAQNIIGKKCYEIMHGLNAPITNCPMEKSKHDCKIHVEEVNDPHIGIPLLVTTSPIFDKNHRMVGVVHVAKDISDIKKKEKVLAKKVRDLEIFYKAAIDREMKIKELKKKVAELEAKVRS